MYKEIHILEKVQFCIYL